MFGSKTITKTFVVEKGESPLEVPVSFIGLSADLLCLSLSFATDQAAETLNML